MRCPCGKELDSTSAYMSQSIDEKGNLLYAVCSHGVVITDKIGKGKLVESLSEKEMNKISEGFNHA